MASSSAGSLIAGKGQKQLARDVHRDVWILWLHVSVLFMTSLIQAAGHKMSLTHSRDFATFKRRLKKRRKKRKKTKHEKSSEKLAVRACVRVCVSFLTQFIYIDPEVLLAELSVLQNRESDRAESPAGPRVLQSRPAL